MDFRGHLAFTMGVRHPGAATQFWHMLDTHIMGLIGLAQQVNYPGPLRPMSTCPPRDRSHPPTRPRPLEEFP